MSIKGSWSRVADTKAYRDSPLWDNLGKKKYESWSEFSNDFTPLVESHEKVSQESVKPKTFLFLDDMRDVRHAQLHDYRKTLTQVSGIPEFKWDIVRTYDEFVDWIDHKGIPDVVSFDIDLDPYSEVDIQSEMAQKGEYDHNKLDQKTGCHCAEYLVERCKQLQHPLPEYYVHSANTLGRPIVKGIMEAARPLIKH